jgi:CubicO group peptidase (beta-lactamase class C family)
MKRRPALFTLVVSAAVFATAAVAADGLDPTELARIPVRMKSFVDSGEISGAVTLVARHGVVGSLEAVGWQDIEARKPMRTDSIFQVMSMTKPVAGVAVMMMLEEGKLTLNDPIERHLPEFRGLWVNISRAEDGTRTQRKPSRKPTIRDLMTHTSGMTPGAPEGIVEVQTKMDLTLAQAVAIYAQQPLDFDPGTKFQYSNTGIATLGRIVEVLSGMPFEQFVAERIFKPLGMKDSFFFPPAEKTSRIAALYQKQKDGKLVKEGGQTLGGDAMQFRKGAKYSAPEFGLYSTASDLANFYQMMLNGGTFKGARLLSRASVETMTAIQTANVEKAPAWGLTWEVTRDNGIAMPLMSVGTFGHGGAFGTHGWVDRKKDLVGVYLIQMLGVGDTAKKTFVGMAGAAVVD